MNPFQQIQAFLNKIKKHDEAATKGPWEFDAKQQDIFSQPKGGVYRDVVVGEDQTPYGIKKKADGNFIEFARTALPRAGEIIEAAFKWLRMNETLLKCAEVEIARILNEEKATFGGGK